jgi:hypothetical protein
VSCRHTAERAEEAAVEAVADHAVALAVMAEGMEEVGLREAAAAAAAKREAAVVQVASPLSSRAS